LRLSKLGAHLHYLPKAVGYHHHLRPFREVFAMVEEFGRRSLPLILKKHPEFARELALNELTATTRDPIRWGLRFLKNVSVASPFYGFAAAVATRLEQRRLPSALISYLLYGSIRRGYLAFLKDRQL
ncbi:MAG: hypothetical protein ABH878_04185, partial [bacterium]